jgi:ketosteroid isomerase-like protein
MQEMLIALVVAVSAAGQTAAPQETAVMSTVNQFVSSFNKGDTKGVVATCADQTAIIDEFPPHEWHGAQACSTWVNDYDADAKRNRITDGFVTLSKPRHIDITADRAYVVGAADYTYKKGGTPVKETGSVFTLVLQKAAVGWRITAWSWAKN